MGVPARFYLDVVPQVSATLSGRDAYRVKLVARSVADGSQFFTYPGSWFDCSERLANTHIVDQESLGLADAHVGRGELFSRIVDCSSEALLAAGFQKGQASLAEHRPIDVSAVLEERHRTAVFGVPIADVAIDEVIGVVDHWIGEGGFHQIATANTDFLTRAARDRELLQILHGCDLIIADGMPLVWASRLLGAPLRERVAGADLVLKLLHLSSRRGHRIFLLGASQESSDRAVERIAKDFPAAQICGRYSPPVTSLADMDHAGIVQTINAAKPDILLVALGNPKQEKWIAMNQEHLQVPVCIGVGGSIDFISGAQRRAPKWMQSSGLEWMHRMLCNPKRLAGRYAANATFLFRSVSRELFAGVFQVNSKVGVGADVANLKERHVSPMRGSLETAAVKQVSRPLGRLGVCRESSSGLRSNAAIFQGALLVPDGSLERSAPCRVQ